MVFDFDIFEISESRVTKSRQPLGDINHSNCSYDNCPTEFTAGGALLYVSNKISRNPRKDL